MHQVGRECPQCGTLYLKSLEGPILQGPNDTEKRTIDGLREILDQIEPKAAYLYYYITVTSNDNSVTVPSVSEAKDQAVQPLGS